MSAAWPARISDGEQSLATQMQWAGLPEPVREHRFHPTRRWRFDLAYPDRKLAVEVEGGAFIAGRHVQGVGTEADMEKYAEALILGWRVLRVTPRMIRDGRALRWVEQLVA